MRNNKTTLWRHNVYYLLVTEYCQSTPVSAVLTSSTAQIHTQWDSDLSRLTVLEIFKGTVSIISFALQTLTGTHSVTYATRETRLSQLSVDWRRADPRFLNQYDAALTISPSTHRERRSLCNVTVKPTLYYTLMRTAW